MAPVEMEFSLNGREGSEKVMLSCSPTIDFKEMELNDSVEANSPHSVDAGTSTIAPKEMELPFDAGDDSEEVMSSPPVDADTSTIIVATEKNEKQYFTRSTGEAPPFAKRICKGRQLY